MLLLLYQKSNLSDSYFWISSLTTSNLVTNSLTVIFTYKQLKLLTQNTLLLMVFIAGNNNRIFSLYSCLLLLTYHIIGSDECLEVISVEHIDIGCVVELSLDELQLRLQCRVHLC